MECQMIFNGDDELKKNKNTADLWETPVEVAKWLDLIPSVLHKHTAQNNTPSMPLAPDVDDIIMIQMQLG